MMCLSPRPGWKFGILICILLGSALGVVMPRPFAPRHQIIPNTDPPHTIVNEVREQVESKSWTEVDLQIDFLQLRDVQEQKIFSFSSSNYEFCITASHDGRFKLTEGYRNNDGSPVNVTNQTYGFNHSPNSWHSLSLHIEGNRSFFQLDESVKLTFGIHNLASADTLVLGTTLRGSDDNSSHILIREFSAIAYTPLTKSCDRLVQLICPPVFLASLILLAIFLVVFLTNRLVGNSFRIWFLSGGSTGLLALSVFLLHQKNLSLSPNPKTVHGNIANYKYQSPSNALRKTTDGSEIFSAPEQNIKSLDVDLSFTIDDMSDSAAIFQTAPGNLGIRLELSPSGQLCFITGRFSSPNELPYQVYVPKITVLEHADYRLRIKIIQDGNMSAVLNGEQLLSTSNARGIKISQVILGNGFDGQRPFRGMVEIRHFEYTTEPSREQMGAVIFPYFFQYLSLAIFAAHLYVTLCLIKNKKIYPQP